MMALPIIRCTLLLLACTFLTVAADVRFELRVDDQELYDRGGYFDYRYLYRGGVPKTKQQTETYRCTQTCTPSSCALPGAQNVTSPYCVLWTVVERGADEESYGTCRCNERAAKYCQSYTCDQSVTKYSTYCDDGCFVSSTTFGKVKSCSCDDFFNASRPYCTSRSCLGYGDEDVKTAKWLCYTPISELGGSSSGAYAKDFCWFFGSNQDSASIAETKDCQCTATDTTGSFCAAWLCYNRLVKKWIWWSSLLASPLAALLHLWVPIFIFYKDPGAAARVWLWLWVLLTYLLVVLLGGIPSLIANTMALLAVTCVVNRRAVVSVLTCCRTRPLTLVEPTWTNGVPMCPTCGSKWNDAAQGTVA